MITNYLDSFEGCIRNKPTNYCHKDFSNPIEMVIDILTVKLIDKKHTFLKNEQKELENQIKKDCSLLKNNDFDIYTGYKNIYNTISYILEHYYLMKGLEKSIEILETHTKH